MEFKKYTARSGIPIYHMYAPWAESVACGVLVKAGSRDEKWPQEAGLAHAVEHMIFRGTKDFPTSKSINSFIEDVGGALNAETGHESTFFYTYLPAREFQRGFKILSQLVLSPTFPEKEIKVEMKTIIQEIKMSNDDSDNFITDKFTKFILGDHPLGREILGTKKSVRSFDRRNFQRFIHKFYNCSNLVFVIVGNVKAATVIKAFNDLFSEVPKGKPNKRIEISLDRGREKSRRYYREVEQAKIFIGWSFNGLGREEMNALEIFSTMIGGGASFPLFQLVRGREGICYSINCDIYNWKDAAFFYVNLGADAQKYKEVEDLILKIITRSKNDRKLLEKAKSLSSGRLALRQETMLAILECAAGDIVFEGRPRSIKDIRRDIKSVTMAKVKKVVEKYLQPEKMLKVILLPKKTQGTVL